MYFTYHSGLSHRTRSASSRSHLFIYLFIDIINFKAVLLVFDLTKCTFFFAQSPSMCTQGSPDIPGRNEHNGLAGWKRRGSSTWTTWYKSTSEKGRCWRKELETTRLEKGWCWLMLWCCPYSGERETILYSLCCRARVYYPTLLSPSPLDRDCHVSETVGWIFQR